MKYAYFLVLRAMPSWLRLSRAERRLLADQTLQPLLKAAPDLRMRHFDAEAFTAQCSDVMMIETGDPKAYYFFIEGLRDSALISTPYFEVVQTIPAVEDGYQAYEAEGHARYE